MLLNLWVTPSILVPNGQAVDQEPYVSYPNLAFPINIQPASPTLTALTEGEMFATYKAFTTYSGVQTGWRLTVSGTADVYQVRGVERYNYGAGQHYELNLAKPKQ